MFSKNIKSIIIIMIVFIMSLSSVVLIAECDMMAMIAKKGHYISWVDSTSTSWDDPYDYFQFMKNRSSASNQRDGYGLVY